jgi:hypothetical protein
MPFVDSKSQVMTMIDSDSLRNEFVKAGWRLKRCETRVSIPPQVAARYPRIPTDYLAFIETTERAVSPDEKAWIVTSSVFHGATDIAYAWNEWESQSLEACSDDESLAEDIKHFWDIHCTLIMSVNSGYSFLALNTETLQVVQGEEPEYEDASVIAATLDDLFQYVTSGDPRIRRWV